MGLRDIGHSLPPGFRFYPSDEELVCHYLYKKIANEQVVRGTLVEIDLHTCEPWQLPDAAKLNSNEWYFFSFRDRKYATGFRANRATISGYWKATGKDRAVLDPATRGIVGMRKTLVFYKNRAPNGIKTGWIMHEFRLENLHVPPKEDWVLCRVFYKSRSENSPQNNCYNNATTGDTSPNMALSPTSQHAFPSTYQHITSLTNYHQGQNPSTFDATYFNNLSHHQDQINGPNPSTSNQGCNKLVEAKCEDDYGFLFDMSLDYSDCPNVEDVGFGNGGSSIFI